MRIKARSMRRHRKPQHEDGVPSPHGFAAPTSITLPGGRIHHDQQHDEWVALAVDKVLGRFPSRAQAEAAVREAAQRKRKAAPDTDVIEDDDWEATR